MTDRISKDRYYLNIAYEVANRSTCIRRKYGTVIVKNDEIISTGYNGAPRGVINCSETGFCLREKLGIESGKQYELCKSVHGEQNAIISAKRSDTIGSTLYLAGIDAKTGTHIVGVPCLICKRFIINAGIEKVITDDLEQVSSTSLCPTPTYVAGVKTTEVEEYIKEMNEDATNNR